MSLARRNSKGHEDCFHADQRNTRSHIYERMLSGCTFGNLPHSDSMNLCFFGFGPAGKHERLYNHVRSQFLNESYV